MQKNQVLISRLIFFFQLAGIRNCPWTPHALDWIYQTPAILVLVINLVFLVIIMWVRTLRAVHSIFHHSIPTPVHPSNSCLKFLLDTF